MSVELDVKSLAEPNAPRAAMRGQTPIVAPQGEGVDPFRHHEDAGELDARTDLERLEQLCDFLKIGRQRRFLRGSDHGLELPRMVGEKPAQDRKVDAPLIVCQGQAKRQIGVGAGVGRRVAELGRHRQEVADEIVEPYRAGGLDRDVVPALSQRSREDCDRGEQERFTAGQNDMAGAIRAKFDQLRGRLELPLGSPRGLGAVAPAAAQVAAADAHEAAGRADQTALPLERDESLLDLQTRLRGFFDSPRGR